MTVSKLLAKAGVIMGLGFGLAFAAGTAADAATAATTASPAISVSPSSGLSDGQSVTVSGNGLQSGDVYHVGECAAVSANSFACGPNTNVTADGNGTFSSPLTVTKTFTGTAADGSTHAIDCSAVQCVVAAFDSSFSGGTANISFS